MHIGMIHLSNRPFPPDIRIEKEAMVLSGKGHRVTVVTIRQNQSQKSHETLASNYHVRRYDSNNKNLYSILFSNFSLKWPSYQKIVSQFINEDKPDFLHVHDFKGIPSVLTVAQKVKIPVIADLHENMPASHVAHRSTNKFLKRFVKTILYNEQVWRHHEKRYLPLCAKIIVVVPEASERLYSYGILKNKVVVVSNTEDETTFKADTDSCDHKILEKYKSKWMISYIGGMGVHRGIDTVIKTLPFVKSRIPDFKLVLVGAKNRQKQRLLNAVESNGSSDLVEVIDWVPSEKVKSYIFASKACLVPHNDFEHTQTTVPHKLFQYMICGKPVIVSDCRPLARIVSEANAGYIFKANDSGDLTEKLFYMYNNETEMKQKGLNGKKAATGSYAWRHDADRLLAMYSNLAQKRGKN